jgi:hypothetical protein
VNLAPDKVLQEAGRAESLYHRLVLVVAPSGAGKTALLRATHEKYDLPYVNVNLELSRPLLDLTTRQRPLRAAKALRQVVAGAADGPVLLDNIEILFDQSLKQDPLRLLKDIARSHVIVASWNGTVDDQGLSYAQPGHPEYHHYPQSELDFLCLTDKGANP